MCNVAVKRNKKNNDELEKETSVSIEEKLSDRMLLSERVAPANDIELPKNLNKTSEEIR